MTPGEDQATRMLERWVRTFQPVVFRAAYLILRDTEGAEDVAQETFLRAFRAIRRVQPGEGARAWLYRIAVNTALNELRRRKRESAALARSAARSEDDPIDRSDTASIVADAIDRLPDRLRVVLVCRYFLELSEREIAHVLRIRAGTVKSRLHEARRCLASDESLAIAAGAKG